MDFRHVLLTCVLFGFSAECEAVAANGTWTSQTLTVISGATPVTTTIPNTASFPGLLGGTGTGRKYLKFQGTGVNGTSLACQQGTVDCKFVFEFADAEFVANKSVDLWGFNAGAGSFFANGATAVTVLANTPVIAGSKMTITQSVVQATAAQALINATAATNKFLFSAASTADTALKPQCGMSVKAWWHSAGATAFTQPAAGVTAASLICNCDIDTIKFNSNGTMLEIITKIDGFGTDATTIGVRFMEETKTNVTEAKTVTALTQLQDITETALTTAAAVTYAWDANAAIATNNTFTKFSYMVFEAGQQSKGTSTTNAVLNLTVPASKGGTVFAAFESTCNAKNVYAALYCFDQARTDGSTPGFSTTNPKMTVAPVPKKISNCYSGGSSSAATKNFGFLLPVFFAMTATIASTL